MSKIKRNQIFLKVEGFKYLIRDSDHIVFP